MRKTVDRKLLVETANEMLAGSNNEMVEARNAIAALVTSVLIDANVYKGFQYLSEPKHPGFTIGIVFDESEARKHVYPDPSRKAFY